MEIISWEVTVMDWKQDGKFFQDAHDAEKFTFKLFPHHPIHKSVFSVLSKIQINDYKVGNSLFIELKGLVAFDIKGSVPSLEELYAAFTKVFQEMQLGLADKFKESRTVIKRDVPVPTLEQIGADLRKSIQATYPLN
jgi:hypothetical protein